MTLYVTAITKTSDLLIDFIEVRLKNGENVSLNWDESGIDRRDDGFTVRYKGVYFDDEYANGRLAELQDFQIVHVELYSPTETHVSVEITEMVFEDGDEEYAVENPPFVSDEEEDTNG